MTRNIGKMALGIAVLTTGALGQVLRPVEVNGKWGYIDSTGKTVIAPQYE